MSHPAQKEFTTEAFFLHAALLDQACAHCPIFLAAAPHRSLGRISVPVWLIVLSDQLWIVALVSYYLTNKLIQRRLLQQHEVSTCDPKIAGEIPRFQHRPLS